MNIPGKTHVEISEESQERLVKEGYLSSSEWGGAVYDKKWHGLLSDMRLYATKNVSFKKQPSEGMMVSWVSQCKNWEYWNNGHARIFASRTDDLKFTGDGDAIVKILQLAKK